MKRGCIAVCVINCDSCGNNIEYGEQYLIIEDKTEVKRLCVSCSLKKKYAKQVTEKGEKVITFIDEIETDKRPKKDS